MTERAEPVLAVECNWSGRIVNRGLRYWKRKFPGRAAWQPHAAGDREFVPPEGIRVSPATGFLSTLI